jgi:uridine kinase
MASGYGDALRRTTGFRQPSFGARTGWTRIDVRGVRSVSRLPPNGTAGIRLELVNILVVTSFESVSTWRRPEPEPASGSRTRLIGDVADTISQLSPRRLRIAIDGRTGAGKTSFGHELAAALRKLGRSTLRASLDDFKHPWRDARERGYDRVTGEGYYRNAYDFRSAVDLMLVPAGPGGSGEVVLCAYDPLTGVDHRATFVTAPDDAVLIVDSVFALRPEYDAYWDFRIWLEVEPEVAFARGIRRDLDAEGIDEATRVRRDRYGPAEEIYIAEVRPISKSDLIIDNNDYSLPKILPSVSD